MIVLTNNSPVALEIVAIFYNNYIRNVPTDNLLNDFPDLLKLIPVIDKFVSGDYKYLHVYDNKSINGYLIEKNGSYMNVENNMVDKYDKQLIVITIRSKNVKTRWITGNYTYEDHYSLYSCAEIKEIHDECNYEEPEVMFDYIEMDEDNNIDDNFDNSQSSQRL